MSNEKCIKLNNLKDSKMGKPNECLNSGHPHSRQRAEGGTVFYFKDCEKYEQIVQSIRSRNKYVRALRKRRIISVIK